ncbi:MAG TPA: hypothetical protein VGB51_02485 [Actinomycetota bacterium]
MRRVAAAFLLLAVGCGGAADPAATSSPSPEPTASPSPTTDDLEGASCEDRQGGDSANFPPFTEVSVEVEDGIERVEFRFEPEGNPASAPQYFVSFVDELLTDGGGAPVEVAGEAFVHVSFMAQGVDLSGEEPEPIYTGPTEFAPGLSTVLEVEQTGDFEGVVSWGIGLSSKTCFVVDAEPDRLRLEFPAA